MKKKTIVNLLTVFFVFIALGCGGYLAYYYYTSSQSEAVVTELKHMISSEEESAKSDNENDKSDFVEIDGIFVQKKFEKIYKENKDFIGWIKIEDTQVDYPVMYTPMDSENGQFYIHRDFDMKYSSAGLPFVDGNCNIEYPTDNIIIYGHNMNAGTMFHDIIKYDSQEFYQEHKTFCFDTIYGDGTYEVLAAFYGEILPEDAKDFKYYEFVNAGNEEEFLDFIENIKQMSIIKTDVKAEYGDKLVTLSTCAYHVKNGRFAVIAKRIDD